MSCTRLIRDMGFVFIKDLYLLVLNSNAWEEFFSPETGYLTFIMVYRGQSFSAGCTVTLRKSSAKLNMIPCDRVACSDIAERRKQSSLPPPSNVGSPRSLGNNACSLFHDNICFLLS